MRRSCGSEVANRRVETVARGTCRGGAGGDRVGIVGEAKRGEVRRRIWNLARWSQGHRQPPSRGRSRKVGSRGGTNQGRQPVQGRPSRSVSRRGKRGGRTSETREGCARPGEEGGLHAGVRHGRRGGCAGKSWRE